MVRILYSLLLTALFSLFISCGGNSDKKSNGLLRPASGSPGEMLIVMDSAQWQGQLGDKIREVFKEEVKGLPREQAMFKINYVDPRRLNDVLKSVKNLLFVMTLEKRSPGAKVVRNYFTQSSIQRIKEDDNLFVYTSKDEFARGQSVMYLFGQNENSLINNITANKKRLQEYFNNAEDQRLRKGLYKAKEVKGISNMLTEKHECFMRIPFGYKLVVDQPGFVWVRQINARSDKNIFIAYTPYTKENIFQKENLIAFRDSVAMNQLFEDPNDPSTNIITETQVPYLPVTTKQITLNGKYAVETRGLWKTNNLSMGGPFVSYAMVDEELGRFYYIEGFVYSPGEQQREFMRELEIILSTFRIKGDIPKNTP